jgi:hypothetical protein
MIANLDRDKYIAISPHVSDALFTLWASILIAENVF